MATQHQEEFVNNIEASMRALAVQGRTPPTISAIMEDAGYDSAGLFAIVTRLKENGENDLVSRLRSAFEYARKMPQCLDDVRPSRNGFNLSGSEDKGPSPSGDPEPDFELDRAIPFSEYKPVEKRKASIPPIQHSPPGDDEAQVLAQVISMLRPLKHVGRTRILGATSMFYGVGE